MNRTANTRTAPTTRTTHTAKSTQAIQSVSPLEPALVTRAIAASPSITNKGNASRTMPAAMNATSASDREVSDILSAPVSQLQTEDLQTTAETGPLALSMRIDKCF